eukprot:1056523-Alexandrium_andersonii.AAC.1
MGVGVGEHAFCSAGGSGGAARRTAPPNGGHARVFGQRWPVPEQHHARSGETRAPCLLKDAAAQVKLPLKISQHVCREVDQTVVLPHLLFAAIWAHRRG